MSGNYYSDDFDLEYESQESSGSGLRKQLESALSEIKELREELRAQQAQAKASSLDALLKEKGIDPAVKELMPKDANPTDWLDKYVTVAGSRLDRDENQNPTPDVDVAPDLKAEQEARNRMEPGGDSTGNTTQQQDPIAQLKNLNSEAEMLAFLNQFNSGGNVTGGGLFG